jgi:hypothetical protein
MVLQPCARHHPHLTSTPHSAARPQDGNDSARSRLVMPRQTQTRDETRKRKHDTDREEIVQAASIFFGVDSGLLSTLRKTRPEGGVGRHRELSASTSDRRRRAAPRTAGMPYAIPLPPPVLRPRSRRHHPAKTKTSPSVMRKSLPRPRPTQSGRIPPTPIPRMAPSSATSAHDTPSVAAHHPQPVRTHLLPSPASQRLCTPAPATSPQYTTPEAHTPPSTKPKPRRHRSPNAQHLAPVAPPPPPDAQPVPAPVDRVRRVERGLEDHACLGGCEEGRRTYQRAFGKM